MRRLHALEQRPWLVSLVAGAGATLLLASVLALILPTEMLERLAAQSDERLGAALGALLVVAVGLARVWLRPGRFSEEELNAIERKPPPGVHDAAARADDEPAPAKGYLR